VLQGWACRALRLDLCNALLGMAVVLGGLASVMTSLQLGSAFLFASWAAAALLGMPAAGRVRVRSLESLSLLNRYGHHETQKCQRFLFYLKRHCQYET